MMFVAYVFTLGVVPVASQLSCNYGRFEYHDNECMFNCEYDDNYAALSTLSFNFIAEECDNVLNAARFGLCSTTSDLSWPSTTCDWPSCQCTSPDEGTLAIFQSPLRKYCLNCTCITGTPPVYKCDTIREVSDPYNWDDFVCEYPPIFCTDDVRGQQFAPGQSWFTSSDGVYGTYCYCDADGESRCEEGFETIVSSSYQPLVDAFYDSCFQYIEDCMGDGSRMISAFLGCPRCDCGEHSVGDSWYTEYQKPGSQITNTCTKCSCESWSSGDRATCEYDDESFSNSSDATCPGPNLISCHSESKWIDCSDSDCSELQQLQEVSEYLESTSCVTNEPNAWCTWQYNMNYFDDGTYINYEWDCDSSVFCGIYGVNDECSFYEWSVDYIDCDGVEQTQSGKQYNYCCNTNYCNFRDIDALNCTKNTRYSEVMQAYYICLYEQDAYTMFYGDDCEPFVEQATTCSVVEDLIAKDLDCDCKKYKMLMEDADSEWRTWLTEQAVIRVDSYNVHQWNEVLGCNINLECDGCNEIKMISLFVIVSCQLIWQTP